MSGLVSGAAFVLDAPEHVPAVWGDDEGNVLWAKGEPFILCGAPGVGKSSLIQQVMRALLGIGSLDVLGLTVTPDSSRGVLYVAADRPAQIARSMRRMFAERDRKALDDRLVVHHGSLPFNIVREPHRLAQAAETAGAGTVVIDSLSDLAMPLSSDEVGAAVKVALTSCTEQGIEVCALHHQRKANGDNRKPTKLDDVYGSRWITSGAGSVVLLHGEAGDTVVELLHLKQPADQVGPLEVIHDHAEGRTTVQKRPTIHDVLVPAVTGGVTAKDATETVYGSTDRNAVERARRKLDQLVKAGHGVRIEGKTNGDPVVYRPIDPRHRDLAKGEA